ncbi:Glycosyl transferase family 2 [Arthrobacter alpinus]|uniref:Glycosyl transferase family 2 n=1 Tax=Arthrobacter alpinus TaxID=656366 RepID=A0A1H5KJD8_9MICC|nr:glycosyltransferase family 2 protein [Arthrobacter alpinus]SEE64527.1 Glycosyl transferase family 2 [Arthrobacter alpinus]
MTGAPENTQVTTAEQAPAATVAIVMRTKNRTLLLERAIQDVLKQEYGDWVLVIVNDGGAQAPVDALVEKYAVQGNGRIHVRHHADSLGMEAASNAGIRTTESTFIVIHDDDDQWSADFLTTTVAALNASGAEGVMVRTEIVYEKVVDGRIEEQGREPFSPEVAGITLFDLLRFNRGVPISFLYRRSVHAQIGYYDESLAAVGDWEFHLRFATHFSIDFIDGEPLAFWNQRPGATGDMGNSFLAREAEHHIYDLQVRERYLKEYADKYGVGALLYLTKIQDRQSHEFHQRHDHLDRKTQELLDVVHGQNERLERLEAAISDASLVSLLRRRYRRFKDRVTGK